jgi:hypothetical protein
MDIKSAPRRGRISRDPGADVPRQAEGSIALTPGRADSTWVASARRTSAVDVTRSGASTSFNIVTGVPRRRGE